MRRKFAATELSIVRNLDPALKTCPDVPFPHVNISPFPTNISNTRLSKSINLSMPWNVLFHNKYLLQGFLLVSLLVVVLVLVHSLPIPAVRSHFYPLFIKLDKLI